MPSTDLAKLVVRLEAEIGRYQKNLAAAEKRAEKFQGRVKKSVSSVQAAFGAISFGFLTKKIIDATVTQENAVKQLETTWKSTEGAVGLSVSEMVSEAQRLQGITIFGDEEIIKAQSQLATFTNITKDRFKQLTEVALDLSVKMDQDLKSSVLQLGKALNDPQKNLSALSRAGIQFSDDQKAVIDSLIESGRLAEAQTIILSELERQFGGSAEAARKTFGGALKGLSNAFGDLLEADALPGVTQGIEELTTLLQDPSTVSAAKSLSSGLVTAFTAAAGAIVKVVNVTKYLGEELAARINGPAFGDIVRIDEKLASLNRGLTLLNELQAQKPSDKRAEKIASIELEIQRMEELLNKSREFQQFEIEQASIKDIAALSEESGVEPIGERDPTEDPEVIYQNELSKVKASNKKSELSLIERLEKQHVDKLLKDKAAFELKIQQFALSSSKQKVKTLLSEGVAMTQGAANTSKKLFNINKALALADAAVSLPSAVLEAVRRGGGWPWGAAFGALTLANGMAQINAIRRSSFSGASGSSPSLAGVGGGATPTIDIPSAVASSPSLPDFDTESADGRGGINVVIQDGAVVTDVDGLVQKLNDYARDNGQIMATGLVV